MHLQRKYKAMGMSGATSGRRLTKFSGYIEPPLPVQINDPNASFIHKKDIQLWKEGTAYKNIFSTQLYAYKIPSYELPGILKTRFGLVFYVMYHVLFLALLVYLIAHFSIFLSPLYVASYLVPKYVTRIMYWRRRPVDFWQTQLRKNNVYLPPNIVYEYVRENKLDQKEALTCYIRWFSTYRRGYNAMREISSYRASRKFASVQDPDDLARKEKESYEYAAYWYRLAQTCFDKQTCSQLELFDTEEFFAPPAPNLYR